MHHFFVEPSQIQGNHIFIDGPDVNHIRNVLRMNPGEEVNVTDGIGEKVYRCAIAAIGGRYGGTEHYVGAGKRHGAPFQDLSLSGIAEE